MIKFMKILLFPMILLFELIMAFYVAFEETIKMYKNM